VPRPATGKTALRIFMGYRSLKRVGHGSDATLLAVLQPLTKADVWC
jgi:hypothetical protein